MPALPAGSSKQGAHRDLSEQEDQLQLGSLVILSGQGVVKGYSKTQVRLVFTPPAQGLVREEISIGFKYALASYATR